MATGPKSSKTATNEYRISIEGNPYPHTLALINSAGDNLNIKKHGFTGPLGQLLSLKNTVYDDANEKLSLIINFIRTPPTFIRTCTDECGNPIP